MAYPVAQTDPTAVFGRRVVAAVIDLVIVFGLFVVLWQSQAVFENLPSNLEYGEACDLVRDNTDAEQCVEVGDRAYYLEDPATGTALSLLLLAANVVIFGVVQGMTGRTPGKVAVGIRTVGEDGAVPGIGKGLFRGVLWIADGPCGFFAPIGIVGFVCALTTQGHRRVGDMAAKTFVVRSSAAGSPIVVPGMTAPPPPSGAWGAPAAGPTESWGTPPPQGGWGTLVPGAAPAPPTDPSAAGWAAPSEPVAPAASPAPTAAPAASAPQWDEARGTYIQWDPAQAAWLQWDEPSKRWIRIAGQ